MKYLNILLFSLFGFYSIAAYNAYTTISNHIGERVERVHITNSGSAVIAAQSGDWIVSATRSNTGVVALDFKTGYFPSTVSCTCSSGDLLGANGNKFCGFNVSPDSTGAVVRTSIFDGTSIVPFDIAFDVICMGAR